MLLHDAGCLFRLSSLKMGERCAANILERMREKNTNALHRRREGRHSEAAFCWGTSRSPDSVTSCVCSRTLFYRWQKKFFGNGTAVIGDK